ncbi:cation-translocating P-type ATPase [Tropicibacter oceani]|uniref:HAD-IC family P-type ATPase n=1 Tax=Tropicibacter oceani TaxID=3058420 RepID=A0ABY8QNA5_9RHOB|nr:HAD-IC family P-type ATPase [Tropicibacter oceani]WGW06025.1 HAD-IC family P-type ATPase [Tropicibacter oceani]
MEDLTTQTASDAGLSQAQVEEARARHGWNALPSARQAGPLRVFLRQFASVLIAILIIAAGLALVLGEVVDAVTIGVVVLLNALLGFVQEWRAETALAALKKVLSPKAMVIRDGQEQVIAARELVPGDLIVLGPGAKVPADGALGRAVDLRIDESVLTGESVPVSKARGDSVLTGTAVVAGRAEARVTAIGGQTEFGKIAQLTGSFGTKQTDLQVKLGGLARQLGAAALLVAAAVVGLGIFMGQDPLDMVMTGLSLSVAIVPEGLPAVVTITLALGAAAMVRQRALARRLQAVETLGAASVICTDKTGTLTENKMTATRIWTVPGSYAVTGTGYDPAGHIEQDGRRLRAVDDRLLSALLEVAIYCSHARIHQNADGWTMVGEPTEGALITLAYKGWCPLPGARDVLAEIPFSSERKRMSVLRQHGDHAVILCKGAPEQVLEICSDVMEQDAVRALTPEDRAAIETAYRAMAADGQRVIALARRVAPDHQLAEEQLTFLGLVGLIDPPRQEVRGAIAAARSAGIRIVMITGDSPITAAAIAGQLGLTIAHSLTGPELDDLDDSALSDLLSHDVLFARTRPEQKMRIVAALQAQGQIVAMTGDGVNDAPALKQADIGVSMGIRGTDVARDASDLVLLDDNFATIVRAIGEGRRQFANVQKFVRYLLSSNAGEVIALVVNIAIGGPLVFLATQILWMNLVTDGVTAVALGLEKAEPDHMEYPPRDKHTRILGLGGVVTIACLGLYTGMASLWIFYHLLDQGVDLARTAAFSAMVVFEKLSVFAFRSLRLPGWRIGWFSNPLLLLALTLTLGAQAAAIYWPPMQALLHTVPMGLAEWQIVGWFALPIVVVPELLKSLGRANHRPAPVAD